MASFYHLRKDSHRGQVTFSASCSSITFLHSEYGQATLTLWAYFLIWVAREGVRLVFSKVLSSLKKALLCLPEVNLWGRVSMWLWVPQSLTIWAHASEAYVGTLAHTTLPGLPCFLTQKLICNGMYFFPGDKNALLVHITEFLPEIYKHDSRALTPSVCPGPTYIALRAGACWPSVLTDRSSLIANAFW